MFFCKKRKKLNHGINLEVLKMLFSSSLENIFCILLNSSLQGVFVSQNDTASYWPTSLKFGACYITCQWGEFKIKMFSSTFLAFSAGFYHKICLFIIFISFLMKYQISTTEYKPFRNGNWWSKFVKGTVFGGLKLSVELYV